MCRPPSWGEAEILAFYQNNPDRILAGLLITMFSATCWIPWAAALSAQMKRMCHPVLANTQLGCGIATAVFVILPMEVWMAAAFRAGRSADLLLFFNDFAYIMFVGLTAPAFFQITCVGIAILADKSKPRILPRWAGFFNLWIASLSLTGSFVLFFSSGPLAWNGIIAFWLPMVIYGIWYPTMFVLLRKAILAEGEGSQALVDRHDKSLVQPT